MEIFAARLKWVRESKGLTQNQVAEKIGMSQSSYSKYEYNLREPNLETLSKLPAIVEQSVDFLIGVTDLPRNAGIIYDQFNEASGNVATLRLNIHLLTTDPHSIEITAKDYDPDDLESVAKKIERLEKILPLWEDRMEQARSKLLKILSDVPHVNISTTHEIKYESGWVTLFEQHEKDS